MWSAGASRPPAPAPPAGRFTGRRTLRALPRPHRRPTTTAAAAPTPDADDPGADDAADIEAARARLTASAFAGPRPLTGAELISIIRAKWGGRSYEARIVQRSGKLYCQIFWRFLEQASFQMSQAAYELQMDAVAEVVTEYGAADAVRAGIAAARAAPGYTGGGGARAVSIPLDVATQGGRAGEWDV